MLLCRLCDWPELYHLHPREGAAAERLKFIVGQFNFKMSHVKGIAFAPPAMKVRGAWWLISDGLVEKIWERYRQKFIVIVPAQDIEEPDDELPE